MKNWKKLIFPGLNEPDINVKSDGFISPEIEVHLSVATSVWMLVGRLWPRFGELTANLLIMEIREH